MAELQTSTDLQLLLTHEMLGATPHVFGSDRARWNKWKTKLADGLEVDPHSIFIVGSGALGVSLNPGKSLRPFGPHSDIDVAVVSARHFDLAWHTLRNLKGVQRLPAHVKTAVIEFAPNYVYWGAIATDRILSVLDFGPQWKGALEAMRQEDATLDRAIKARLYRDVGSLREYQIRGFRQARNRIDAGNASG